ncbi:MAG: hypothetical protein KKH12_05040 [Gammaproteobacteria bacterium]|nr:hypothetical protein [Gammaproteobacteria bacterium]MBU1481025.1 hypothetical protein [Gammaproteobacteria bacterium]
MSKLLPAAWQCLTNLSKLPSRLSQDCSGMTQNLLESELFGYENRSTRIGV